LRINLFEPLNIQLGEQPAIDEGYPRRKAKALFVYLYLNRGGWLTKYKILADVWPEASGTDPRRVKHTVQVLRAALEGPRPSGGWHIILERDGSYAFNAAAPRWSDVEEFQAEVRAARQASDSDLARAHYERAIDLRRGPFLAEFCYDDWAVAERAIQDELYLDVLEEAARVQSSGGDVRRAIELLRIAIREDPLRESSYVELMRSLARQGRRPEALCVYAKLRDILASRLNVDPRTETTELYHEIRGSTVMKNSPKRSSVGGIFASGKRALIKDGDA
jgi:DNA-binding SARP family transcriptional activator